MAQELDQWSTGRLLVTAARMLEHSWEQLLRAHGVSHAGFTILDCLLDGPLPQRGLAHSCRVTDQTISRSIERLQRIGLVSRATDPLDERRQLVSITVDGRELHGRVTADISSNATITAAVREPERLRGALLQLIEALEGRAAAGGGAAGGRTATGGMPGVNGRPDDAAAVKRTATRRVAG